MSEKLTREDCLSLLRDRAAALSAAGETRYPKRSDFTDREVVAIKAFLGPWPRALEAAGLKPPRAVTAAEKNRARRERAKRRRTAAKQEHKPTEG
ncbi:MAG: hypothetical protein IKI63_05205 [Clostridia bacterium]|nr:hypothetical protein [Clostridia bacterium]